MTLAAPLRVNVRLINRETGEIKEQEVFMGDFPLMTDTGTFIINGAERVIVSQLVRSPGAYYGEEIDPTGKHLYNATVIPNRGAWIELETDTNDVVSVRIDRTRKMPVTYFIRALGFDTDEKIIELFGDDPRMLNTIERDGEEVKSQGKAVIEIYKRLRPGEPANEDNATQLLNSLFFDPKRYDLATVGRYKLTKKLGWKRRILGKVLAEPIVDHETGEIVIPQAKSSRKTCSTLSTWSARSRFSVRATSSRCSCSRRTARRSACSARRRSTSTIARSRRTISSHRSAIC